MGAGSPQEYSIEVRRMKAEDLRCEGMSYRAIAIELGCSHDTVMKDLEANLAEVHKLKPLKTEERRSLRIEQLTHTMREAWATYKRSVGTIKKTMRRAKQTGADGKPQTEVVTTEEVQAGDTSALRVIKDCIAEIGKFEGSYSPQEFKGSLDINLRTESELDEAIARLGPLTAAELHNPFLKGITREAPGISHNGNGHHNGHPESD